MNDPTLKQEVKLPDQPLPILSIGTGGIVKDAHYPAYQKAGFTIAGAFDPDAAKPKALAKEFSIERIFPSLEEICLYGAQNPAVFDVAVPAGNLLQVLPHLPDQAAVLIQKPLGENLDQARQILHLCREKKLQAAVNFQLRYAPYVLAARDLMDSGLLGELCDLEFRINVFTPWHLWDFLKGIPRMEILYHSIHYIDAVRSFLGDPSGIYAKTLAHPNSPDLANTRSTILMDYGDQVRATITANHNHAFGDRHQESYIKWEGTHGAVKVRMGLLLNYPEGKPDAFEYCRLDDSGNPLPWKSIQLEGSWFPHAFMGTMAGLMRYVQGEAPTLPTSVEDAYRTMACVESAYRSSEQGGHPVDYNP